MAEREIPRKATVKGGGVEYNLLILRFTLQRKIKLDNKLDDDVI